MKLLLGNCLEQMKTLPDNSVDAVVTDSPYGLSFMGKHWDYDVPTEEIWRETLRVLKPGGHLLSFFGTRTYHRGAVRIEDAGFEIRDQIMWIYGSGFPKSHNIKEGDFKGWGTALKPANEPIVVARKPLEKGLTVAENVLKWGTGAINIDASRIEYQGEKDFETVRKGVECGYRQSQKDTTFMASEGEGRTANTQGRWPANILFDEEAANMLDEQSGTLKTHGGGLGEHKGKGFFAGGRVSAINQPKDSGGASRFFYVAKASKSERNAGLEGMPEKESYYMQTSSGKPSMSDGHTGKAAARANFHPTVKPIKLMQYLIKLVTPPNGTVLDPFMGSGSTGVAAKKLGFDFIGCEMNEEYFEIAKKRIGV